MVWTEAQTTFAEKTKKTPENRQLAWTNEKADELAKIGASEDGAEIAELMAKEGLDTGKMKAATR